MTDEEIETVLGTYESRITDDQARLDHRDPEFVHLLAMIPQMREMLKVIAVERTDSTPDRVTGVLGKRLDKLHRWLGFMQGVLWTKGIYTLDELKAHNHGPKKDSPS